MSRLQLTFNEDTTKNYMKIMHEVGEAEAADDMEQSFPSFRIDMCIFGHLVYLERGNNWIEVGECESKLID